jgi:hypothetical protein
MMKVQSAEEAQQSPAQPQARRRSTVLLKSGSGIVSSSSPCFLSLFSIGRIVSWAYFQKLIYSHP